MVQNSGSCCNGIEQLDVTFKYNGTPFLLVLIYRPPLVPLSNLLNIMASIISNTSNATQPVIVLGDFNEDVINNPNSSLLSLMSTGGSFNQMVNSPTTDRGTLIDLVFVKNLPTTVLVNVSDTYYSDHDTISIVH